MLVALAVLLALAPAARAEPSDGRLVLTGLLLAPPTYLVGVTLHEGSHALAAKLAGGTVDEVRVFPPGIDPRADKFRFGWVYARGLRTKSQKIVFYIAPKITNALLLGAFSAVLFTSAWPDNRYAQLALTVGATGMWVDFSKDLLAFSRHNDAVKIFHLWCMRGWKQVPARLVYAGAVAGFGYVVARGYQKTFGDEPTSTALVVPLASATF